MLLQTDLILLLRFPEPPEPSETPQAKQFAHLSAEADNLQSERHSKKTRAFRGTPKGAFLPQLPHNLEARVFLFPLNLLSALCHRLQTQRPLGRTPKAVPSPVG